MDKLTWSEKFSVGVPEIDAQHMEIIRIINKLIDANNVEVSSEVISETLTSMTNYAIMHFKTEEDFMLRNNFPGFTAHKKEHTEYRKKTLSFCLDTMVHKNSVPVDILTFLKDWWMHHILESDMKYKGIGDSQKNI
jgi:hemerythrin